MAANRFTDPRTGTFYDWARNHKPDGAAARGVSRSVDSSATTDGTGVVRQQGAEQPMTLAYSGVITASGQHDRMVAWAALGRDQTIYFTDATGDQFEVLVTSFESQPVDVGSQTVWEYSLEMEVVEVLAGTWTSTALT